MEPSNLLGLTGLDAIGLIRMIVKAANTARMHKSNCRKFAQYLTVIGNLLEQLNLSEMKTRPGAREPFEQLEDALRRAYLLVNSCQDRSIPYVLAMGWNIDPKFKEAEQDIERYLRIIPLINLVEYERAKALLTPHSDSAAEVPQPVEVLQAEAASTVENQLDLPTSRFKWRIENFSRLNTNKHYSDIFKIGGYKWRVLIFPKGNNVDRLSMYLDVADSATLPYGWTSYARFSLAVINQIHDKYTIRKDTEHEFNARQSYWGFRSFMPLSELYDPSQGYRMNDTCIVEAEVAVCQIRLKKEQEEKECKKKEKAEAFLYTIIKVARNEDLGEQIGRDIYFDLVDHDKVRSFRIQKQMPFNLFKEEVAKEFGVPVQFQRFWLWAKRQNQTYRPNRPLTHQEEAQSIGQLREVSNKVNNAELKLFLEVELGPDLRPLPPPDKTKEDILLFFKLYDPEKEELRYVGRLFVKGGGKPSEILTKLNEMAGFSPNEEIELYEEIKFEPSVMCERIDKKLTCRASQLEDGDIICFQKLLSAENASSYRHRDVPSFLEYVHNRQVSSRRRNIGADRESCMSDLVY